MNERQQAFYDAAQFFYAKAANAMWAYEDGSYDDGFVHGMKNLAVDLELMAEGVFDPVEVMKDVPLPEPACAGRKGNVCVAEGCYGESCRDR